MKELHGRVVAADAEHYRHSVNAVTKLRICGLKAIGARTLKNATDGCR